VVVPDDVLTLLSTATSSAQRNDVDAVELARALQAIAAKGWFARLVDSELAEIAGNPRHAVPGALGQLSYVVSRDSTVDYTIRLGLRTARAQYVRWTHGHTIAFSERGTADHSVFDADPRWNINVFERGEQLRLRRAGALGPDGDHLVVAGPLEVLDLRGRDSLSVIHVINVRDPYATVHWCFDRSLTAQFSEDADIRLSRLECILEVLTSMGQPLPQPLLDTIMDCRNPPLARKLVAALLACRDRRAFSTVYQLIDSEEQRMASLGEQIMKLGSSNRSVASL
jgi:hypothetical protein